MPNWIKYIFLPLITLLFGLSARAQNNHVKDTVVGVYVDPKTGDSIPLVSLETITLEGKVLPKWKKYIKEWNRLRNAVYVTYPYAMAASKVMLKINMELEGVRDPAQRKRIILRHEKEMKSQFMDRISNLSVYQGKVLMKLIKRQTGENCYEIIKTYKGGFTAAFWESVAFVFGSSLKQEYDPLGDDQALEAIVSDVERMYGNRTF